MSSTFVTLKEVLEGRGAALEEGEVWGLLLGTAEALLDLSYKGQTNICNIIMPGSLLLSATGTLAFKSCSQSESSAPFAAPEMLQGRPVSSKLATEKVAVYSLGMTLYWCVDYRVPQNQPVQLSDALNVLLLSMCEDLAHRRVGLAAILEACEEQHKTMPNLSPTRTIRQLVEQWSNYTAESASSDPTVPLSGRSQMVRERLHGKHSAYGGYPESNLTSGSRRRLSSDSEINKAGLSQQKMRAPWGRTSSPPFSVQTLPNRIQRGLQHRASSSSSWSSRAPYASDSAIRPVSPPISISESTTSLNTRKAKTLGPEFVRMGDEPQVTLELPGSIVSKKGRSSVSQREVCVYMPNDACLLVRCDIKSRGRDVFDMVVAHANLVEHFYFGLAFIDDDEFFFLEPELKISKVAPDIWKKQPGTPFTLYLRVKFFADDVSFIQHRLTRHQYYLQLRKDVLEDRLHCSEDTALYLAALALQAEFGDYMAEVYGRTYFQVEQYVPKSVCDRMSLPCLREELPRLHANYAHMLPDEAEMEFLKLTQQLSEYGVLFHRVGREREKRPVGGDMQLGISSRGVTVYELRTQTRYMCRHFPWSDTQSISTGRHKFSIECGPSGKKHVFQTESSRIAQYLLNLCSAQHKFHSEMTSRQLTHTLTSDDNLEKYLATCRRQHQMKRLSCSEMILSNVGVANALASDSISKSCDDLTAKADTHSRKLHDISETRESSQDISTPEPLHRIMSSVSLQKQDSETPSRSSSSRDTPTRTPPEREIICVTLKKDPKLGYGFVIVGEDNTGKLDLGIFIASIIPDGPADKDGRIRPGGRLISLNKTSLEGVSFNAAAAILQNSPEEVELIVSQPKQGLNDSKLSLEGGCVGMESGPGNEFRPGVEELEEALTTILTPKHTRRLHVPVVRILDTQDSWSRCSSVSNLHAPDVLSVELRKKNGSLGISVAGGVNTNMRNGGIYIKSLVVGGAADLDGRIQIGDRLLEVDGNNLRGVTHRQAVECLKRTGEVVSLLVERDQMVVMDTFTPERQLSPSLSNSPSSSPTHRRDVTMETTSMGRHKDYSFVSDENTVEVLLHRSVFGLGFSVCVSELCSSPTRTGGSVVRIRHLFPGQPAMESGLLLEGDVILAVNGQSLKGLAYQRVMQILRGSSDEVRLTVCRPPPGTLPEVDTSSLSATPLKETRSMSLDLRMRDLSMDFHRLLQMKAEETRQEKQLLLQRLERLEQREREEREREEREERGRVEEKGREEEKTEDVEDKKTEGKDEKYEKEREEQKAGEEKERAEKRIEEEEGEEQEEESPPSSPSPPSSTSGSEPGDTPIKEAGRKHTCIRRVELNNALPVSRSSDMLNKGAGVGLNNDVTGSDLSKKVELKTVSGSKSSDTLNKGVELDDKPTKEEVPKDTSCVNKVELNNAAVRKAGSSDELTRKGEGSSEEAGSSLTASHPIAAAGAVAMATDSSSPSAVDAALGHLENITFPSGVCQQVNGSTISMMADGLAFLADEEYLTISSLPHTHTHTHTSHPTHTHSHSSHPPHTHSHTHPAHTHSHTHPVHTHSHTHPAHTHTHTDAATHSILATQCTRTHTHVHSLTSHTHVHSHTDCPATHTHASEPPTDTHTPAASTDTHMSEPPPHTHIHTCATFADTHTAAAAIAAAEPSPITLQPPDLGIRSLPKTNKKHTHTNRLSWVDEEEEEEDDPNREILKEFELSVTLVKSWSGSFGFTIARSRLDGCYYIQEVLDNPARSDGRLRAGDRLIIVNGHDVTAVTDDVAMGILRSSSRKLVMVLGRAVQNLVIAPPADSLPDIILHKTLSGQLGIKLTGGIGSRHQGIYVLEVVMNSPASEEGSLQPGDKILYISGRCTLGMTLEDAVKACENASRKVKLKALRDDQPLPSKAKWNGLFDWKKERRFFPRFDDYEDSPEEGHERCESSVRFRPHPSPPPPQEESCIIQVEFSKPESGGLGFALMGGANGSALRVKEICRGGVAHTDGRLRVGDILLEVNGVIVSGLSHSKVVEMLRQAEGVVQLTICRDFLSLTPPTERRPPPTEHQSTEVKDDEIVPEKDQPTVPLNNTRRTSVHSQESSSSTPPVSRCCPSLRADDLLPTRISTPPPHDPTGDQDTPPAWSSDEEDEDEDDTQALKLLPPTGRPIVSEDELSTLAIISPCKTGSYSGSRIKTLIQILEHQDQQEILKEFMDLQHMKSSDECVVGRAPENRLKNRYRDILPYDKTRVLLGEEQGYINASYIRMQVGDEELLYIASQAPMSSTVGSFWQMVWESRCDVVVMTTREEEAGRSKVYRYWPDSMDIPMETDRYQLTLDNHQTLRDFHINVVKMVDKKNGNCHFVKQVCVCRWPDHRPAGSSEQLVRLVSYMRAVHSRGPIIVHCSGGIGRTAVLICTDIIVRRIHRDLTVSVSDIVKEMRTQRHGMIQTKEQYLFCYKVWLEILQGILQLHGNQWQLAASV